MTGFPHGTNNGYSNLGCRCASCRHAGMEYQVYMTGLRATRLGPCTVQGCERGQYAKGLCGAHYERQRNNLPDSGPIHESTVRDDGTLRCVSCQEWFPDSCFPSNVAKPHRRGRHSECTICGTDAKTAYRARNKVPCEDCGTPVEGKGRSNSVQPRTGPRIQLDPSRPYLCRICVNRRTSRNRKKQAA